MTVIDHILNLFANNGHSQYGGEAVTQAEHALQAATLAESAKATPALITAALLHDVGHLLHHLPDDAPDTGIDDRHESVADHFLQKYFPPSVTEPVRLHVAAKRYLCSLDPNYLDQLSRPSLVSLNLQGGPMSAAEISEFNANPFSQDALLLRRWDDLAKVPRHSTPPLAAFRRYLEAVCLADGNLSDSPMQEPTP